MTPFLAASSAGSWWPPVVQTLIGALIGASGAIVGGAFGSWFTWQNERQSLASALAGEVESFMALAAFREVRQCISWCLDETRTKGIVTYRRFPIEDHPFPVFEHNVGKIGFLPAGLTGRVTEFYTLARGLAQDFRTLSTQDLRTWSVQEVATFLESIVSTMDGMTSLSQDLIPRLKNESARTWKDYLSSSPATATVP